MAKQERKALSLEEGNSLSVKNNGIVPLFVNSSGAFSSGYKPTVLLRGWSNPKNWTQEKFLKKMGHFHQYNKDNVVQPIKNN